MGARVASTMTTYGSEPARSIREAVPKNIVSGTTGSPTVTTITTGNVVYDNYTFTASGSITFQTPGEVHALVVGAAALGDTTTRSGGAGGVIERVGWPVNAQTYTVTVGTTSGASSTFDTLTASGGSTNGTSGNGWPGTNIQGGTYRASGGAGSFAGAEGQFQASEARQGHGWGSYITGSLLYYGAGTGAGPGDGQGGAFGDAGPTSSGSLAATNKGAVIIRVRRAV